MGFIDEVIAWYKVNKRDLPWRKTTDPYIIWLSEIILQQTRVDQGLPYFNRFSEKYPRVADFAAATEDEILNMWQGLGYYSRGRNMHRTAQLVMEEHAGYFPKKYAELIKLKGVGEYTAAAISSFSANEAKAVVDGNVFRVLARYFGIEEPINSSGAKKLFTELANEVIDRSDPATSNQALMEFGSLQCRPKNPLCETCPLRLHCQAFQKNMVSILPVKLKKSTVRLRYFNYIVLQREGRILLNKRGPNDIWQNLYEFPLIETHDFSPAQSIVNSENFKNSFGNAHIRNVFGPVKHILSHQKIHAQFIVIDNNGMDGDYSSKHWFFTDISSLENLAQPKLIFSFLKKFLDSI
ncbi:MAG: A/G-specific adenine glycosylase [Sphingobacteriaceae bacterium]|nr:A/G-specific adenine glycosylase [Sphingobacteriaceae bacterium]